MRHVLKHEGRGVARHGRHAHHLWLWACHLTVSAQRISGSASDKVAITLRRDEPDRFDADWQDELASERLAVRESF